MPKVADIASIRNGFAFRGRIESDKEGDTRVIQASDLTQAPELDMDALACVQLGKKAQRNHLDEHDIVFLARGMRQRAYRPIRQPVEGKPIITARPAGHPPEGKSGDTGLPALGTQYSENPAAHPVAH